MGQEVFWLCATENGAQTDEVFANLRKEHKRVWKNVETNSGSCRRQTSR